jgi:hypothetical protein
MWAAAIHLKGSMLLNTLSEPAIQQWWLYLTNSGDGATFIKAIRETSLTLYMIKNIRPQTICNQA